MQRKRVFSTLVELLDNVENYSPGRDVEEKFGKPIAMIRLVDGVYYLTTGNLILNSRVNNLKEKIDSINNADREGLMEMFVKALTDQKSDTDSTGSLGLIEMSRKSGSKMEYQFDRINDDYSYYMLTVSIKQSEEA
jgi:hypothetical protein